MTLDPPLTITELDELLRVPPADWDTLLCRRMLSTLRHLLIVHDYLETRVCLIGDRVQHVESATGVTVWPTSGNDTVQP